MGEVILLKLLPQCAKLSRAILEVHGEGRIFKNEESVTQFSQLHLLKNKVKYKVHS